MQSHNYVPGVSGWKIDQSGRLELNDGNRRVIASMIMVTTAGPGLTNDQAAESITAAVTEEIQARAQADAVSASLIGTLESTINPKPFIVVDGVTYMNEAFIKESSIGVKIAKDWSVKAELHNGDYVVAGIGLGIDSQCLFSAEKFRVNCMCGGGPAGLASK